MDIGELRFLVVEDHGFQRWIVANMLEGLGARYVFSAADGKAALELIAGREPPIDVIITDLDMPGMDGMEFIRHVGAANYPISLIVASGLENALIESVRAMTRAYGVNLLDAIGKPVTAAKLKAALRLHGARGNAGAANAIPAFTVGEVAAGLERHEFEPFFQPKVELRTHGLKGAEALARWRHPRLGIVRPLAFVELMEKGGLIDELTRVMIAAAALNCRRWRDAGLDAQVSVNLSAGSLRHVGFGDRMVELVGEQGLEPKHVIFEVTETAAQGSVGASIETLSRLRMKGFGLSIDDYGTGYSSMKRLAQMPFTELKVDQSFVKHAAARPSSRAVLESSLEIAGKLGIVAVAEGVENRADWDLLRSLGCNLAQGYLIAKPMSAGDFMNWVRTPQEVQA